MNEPGVVVQAGEADTDRQAAILRNVTNLRRELPDVAIELVMFGPAVRLSLPDAPLADALGRLRAAHVEIVVCANSLDAQNIPATALAAGIGVVGSAMAELVRRQHAGWAYLRP